MRSCCITSAVLFALLLGTACDRAASPPNPAAPAAPGPAVTQLSISGLPDPLLFDVPSSLRAGSAYELAAIATYSDGSTRLVKPGAAIWASDDPTVAFFVANRLQARREGASTISVRLTDVSEMTAHRRDVTVWEPGPPVQEARKERIDCDVAPPCRYAFCPPNRWSPFWLFPVHEDGTIELIDSVNPGWGSPNENVTQLSPKGERMWTWLLLRDNPQYKRATVPGGFMYVLTMNADVILAPCGDASAVWTHPR